MDLVLIRWVSEGCSQILTEGIHGIHVDLVLIRLVDMGFRGMFSDPYCRCTGPTYVSGFNQTGGHGF